jgi:hypothetical protein
MAHVGCIPKRLSKCAIPVCAACGKYISDPKSKARDPSKSNSRFSNQVTVYQWTSWCLDTRISQMAGFLTRNDTSMPWFRGSLPDFSYVHLMQSQSAEEAVNAKQSFEDYESHGVEVKHYHADNGILSKSWKDNCRERHQGVSYAGVNSHHQMDDVSDAFGPSRTGPMLNSCASPMAVRNHSKIWPTRSGMQMIA